MKSITILSFGFYAACRLGNAYELDPADIDLLVGHPIHETNDFKHSHEHRLKTDGDLNKYPNITLDYGIHRPTYDNPDAGYVLYKNIRYGQNPIGDLRFALPIAPAKVEISNDTELPVFDGSDGHSCYQANTRWANDKVVNSGRPYYNWEKAFRTETDGDDCLFLDVATPTEAVVGEKYPVLVWIYGGGYIYGAKDVDLYSPAGFYRRATANNKFVYVAINYRLGAFGFLAGPKFKAEGGRPNLGLYDQRLALKWVQDNIDRFFGDPMRVTVMGESAGAGSIVHQLVWNEGGDAPNNTFQKAIISSPAWVPIPGSQEGFEYQDATYVRFLEILGAKDLAEARNKSEDEIKEASRRLIWEAPYGTFVTGPVVDGDTIKDHPLTTLLEGKQDKTVQIFTGTVGGEGLPFVPTKTLPSKWEEIRRWRDWSRDDILTYIFDALPLLNNQAVEEILHLYSPYDYEYWNGDYFGLSIQTQRIADIVGQALIQCTARGISKAYDNNTYHYIFEQVDNSEPNRYIKLPLLHGGDVRYTFYDLPASKPHEADPTFSSEIAENWQKYLLGFVLESDPNYLNPIRSIQRYGREATVVQFEYREVASRVVDKFKGFRCDEVWPGIWKNYGEGRKGEWDDADDGREGKGVNGNRNGGGVKVALEFVDGQAFVKVVKEKAGKVMQSVFGGKNELR